MTHTTYTSTDILDTLYDEIVSSVSGLSPQPDVQLAPSGDDERPLVVLEHVGNSPVQFNNASRGVAARVIDGNGDVVEKVYKHYLDTQIDFYVQGGDKEYVEDAYNAISRDLDRFKSHKNPWDFHPRCRDIGAGGTTPIDDENQENPLYVNRCPVNILWWRGVTESGTPISKVLTTIEGVTYTTDTKP